MIRLVVVLIAVVASVWASAQPRATVCYASGKNEFTSVGPPAEYLKYKALKASARTQSTNIEVTYEGFTPQAQAAFQDAVDIWEAIIQTPVTIRIHARWVPLAAGVLGSASPAQYVFNFADAPKRDVWYPIALGEKLAGRELNSSSEYDIEATFNSAQPSWHLGPIGSNPPADKYDLVSVVLHEIGHGLGITHGYNVVSSQAVIPSYFSGMPVVYETNITAEGGGNYVSSYTPPSFDLGSAMTSKLYYSSPFVKGKNSDQDAVLYTPSSYAPGSSIAHLDELTYPAGDVNSLMTPAIGAAERILDPGPIVWAILYDMGWNNTALHHTPLVDTEDTTDPYHVIASVKSDLGYYHDSVKLTYSGSVSSPVTVAMVPTGNADEYAADIPPGDSTYHYSISVFTNDSKTTVIPAPIVRVGQAPGFSSFSFHVGPDLVPPVIDHNKPDFASILGDFTLGAVITDNSGVDNVTIQWELNGVPKPDVPMTMLVLSDYYGTISKSNLHVGDTIRYRIRAQDGAVAGNVSFSPATGLNQVLVSGGDARDSYQTDFEDGPSQNDFLGNGFSMTSGQGFTTHIQFKSPYPAAGAGQHQDLICNLRVPIKVARRQATIRFDEIVLVEPGEDGAAWPSPDFYDYVVVEGSNDGVTWQAIADGYDSRHDPAWLHLWNEYFDRENSNAVGDTSLYRTHTFNLLNKFKPGDEVLVRFRLYSDAFTYGWGWAIDNLKIQVDDIPPTIRHQHYDFLLDTTRSVPLNMKVDDPSGVKRILVEFWGGTAVPKMQEVIVNPAFDHYTSAIDVASLGLKAGDALHYRIGAYDSLGNSGWFPTNGAISSLLVSYSLPTTSANTFYLTGNFFRISTTTANSYHPYRVGMGIDGNSEFTLIPKRPIIVSNVYPKIQYDDIVLTEYNGTNVKDYVIVEASKDGTSWKQLISPYSANALPAWKEIYDAGGVPDSTTATQHHEIDIIADGNFKAGDVVLIRFRLHSDSVTGGWGWRISNLNIQIPPPPPVTGLEPQIANEIVSAWPNPLAGNTLYLKLTLPELSGVQVEILNMQGQLLSTDQFPAPPGESQREYEVSSWSSGVYVVKVKSVLGTSVSKLIKLR